MPQVLLSHLEIQTEALLDFKVLGLKALLLMVQNRLVAQKLRIRMMEVVCNGNKTMNHLFGKIHSHGMTYEGYIPKSSLLCTYLAKAIDIYSFCINLKVSFVDQLFCPLMPQRTKAHIEDCPSYIDFSPYMTGLIDLHTSLKLSYSHVVLGARFYVVCYLLVSCGAWGQGSMLYAIC